MEPKKDAPNAAFMNVEAKLGTLTWKKSPDSHISIKDASICATACPTQPCTTVCPAKVYEWEEAHKKIVVNYENCIECGACRMLCPSENITCDWPRGGFGVAYKFG